MTITETIRNILRVTDGGPAAADGDAPTVWWVRNNTPRPIWFEHDGRVFTLAPLEKRSWSTDPRAAFPQLSRLLDRHQVDLTSHHADPGGDPAVTRAVRVTLILGFLWLVSFGPLSTWWWQRVGGALAACCAFAFLVLLTRPKRGQTGRQLRRWTGYNATMVAVVAIGVLLPAAVVYFATDLSEVVSVWPNGFSIDASRPLVLVGRFMQLTFIAVATLLPALMYFQFDAERLGTLRDRWIQNVFRLDPTVSTRCDVDAKYGRQLDEAYGSPDDGRGRLTRGRRSPIIVTTLILGFGWLLILLKAGDTVETTLRLLSPDQSLVTYAFLGAYFFGIQAIWQGYVRADLRPKTYTTITVRVLVVVIVAWLLEATMGASRSPEPLYMLAFLAGIVPDQVLHLIRERVLSPLGNKFSVTLDRQQQLTELEGIDLYERTRLSEEGITSVEALAHHDILDLFFKTRFPAARLVDWVDQAILVMYLNAEPEPAAGAAAQPSGATLRRALRGLGIRTASDLVSLARQPQEGGQLSESLRAILHVDHCRDVHQRLCLISATLDHSEWIGRIENWRRSDLIESDADRRRYIDGSGDLRYGDPRLSTPAGPHGRDVATRHLPQPARRPHGRARRPVFTLVWPLLLTRRPHP